jgi:DNA-binding MarR family transcriptional regulator
MFDAFDEATRGLRMTPPRFTALVVIGANPGLSQTALGRVLGIARSGAMLMTDLLEARRLVERRHQPEDGRAWGLHLTRGGERFVEQAKRRVLESDRKKSRMLSKAERRELLRLLGKVAQ